jgi:hypothetical protein
MCSKPKSSRRFQPITEPARRSFGAVGHSSSHECRHVDTILNRSLTLLTNEAWVMGVTGVLCRGVAQGGGMRPADFLALRLCRSGVTGRVEAIVIETRRRHSDRAAVTRCANVAQSPSFLTLASIRGGDDASHSARPHTWRNPRTSTSLRANHRARLRAAARAVRSPDLSSTKGAGHAS